VIVDSSALVAILRWEPERVEFIGLISAAPSVAISAATYLETAIVIDALKRPDLSREFDTILSANYITVEPVTPTQAKIAREAYRDFGKGSGHAARLNFGDCLAYALAKEKSEPLLFKGTDFQHTDVRCAREV
jgi:ribonuclease VapC